MLPKISLLDELRKGGYETSLITTFNAYLPFYEDVVLRRLVNAGVRHNVLLMDAQQYAISAATNPPRLAGRQYSLMPVRVSGAFHPKLIFLAGKNKGLVVVGSHNMTLAGFGFNREVTNFVRIEGVGDAKGIALAQQVWAEIDYWLAHFAQDVPEQIKEMARRVRDFAPWLNAEAEPDDDLILLAGRPGTRSLWSQFTDLVDGEQARVSLAGAFFDNELRFLDRVQEDLRPASVTVAVDPATVQMPAHARSFSGISLVRGDRLGVEEDKEAARPRYLHAKGIFIEQADGSALFASGSANPSRPAWLASESEGNVELVLARRGEDALATAQALGFDRIRDMPALNDADWETIEKSADNRVDLPPPRYRTGLAAVEGDRVLLSRALVEGLAEPEFVLRAADDLELSRTRSMRIEDELAITEFPAADLERALTVHAEIAGQLVLKLWLHHTRDVEEQARTGTQRRFREALQSLETDTPNIGLLIECIDKIVFSEDRVDGGQPLRRSGERGKVEAEQGDAPATLAVDVADMKRRKSKKRLTHSGDFAYLLDALIYHLRVQHVPNEERDRFGRSEEEQVGADDDSEAETELPPPEDQDDLLRVCHAKVGTVIRRMITQLEAYSKGKQNFSNVLLRLLAVLAVLRELRSCDGRVAWVEKGKTTVPKELRLRLLEAIMLNLFERGSQSDPSLLHLELLGDEFCQSDDVARLKGLVLWLAWDCGLALVLKKPFMESDEESKERLQRNAMALALAQMIRTDEVVIDEARQSIGALTSSEMNWLKDMRWLAERCESLRTDKASWQPADKAEPGAIAVHRQVGDWDLRLVASRDDKRISLVRLNKDDNRIAFAPKYLAVTSVLPASWA